MWVTDNGKALLHMSLASLCRCSNCDCSPAGTLNKTETCDPVSGNCLCKTFVTERRCDTCTSGASYLDEDNPYGCSKGKIHKLHPHIPLSLSVKKHVILKCWQYIIYRYVLQYFLLQNTLLIGNAES